MAERYTIKDGGYTVEFTSYKKEVLDALGNAILAWLESVGADASRTAKTEGVCPVKTGNLRDSITYAIDYSTERTVYVGTNVFYGKYQEFGTMNGVPARHFIQYGVTAHVETYADWLAAEAMRAVFYQ